MALMHTPVMNHYETCGICHAACCVHSFRTVLLQSIMDAGLQELLEFCDDKHYNEDLDAGGVGEGSL